MADGNFGQQEDESARQQRMDESAQYMIENYPRAYGTMLAFDNGVANSVGSIQEGLGLGDDAMKQATAAVESQKPIWDTWDAKYGDNYFSNPKGLASAIGSAAGSTLPILALGELMPGAVVARGVKLGQAGLTRLGLGGWAQKGAVKGLLEEAVRSPIPNAADSLMEYGGVVHDLKQNGYSDEAARNQARSILAKNMLLDTATIPLELSLMKGLRGTNGKLFNSHLRDSLGTRLAKGTGRAGLLAAGNGLVEGLQEGAQNALEDQTKGERDGGWWNPLTWTEDDWKAARDGFAGGAFLGLPGGFVQGFHPERPMITDEMNGRSPEDIAVNSTWTAGQEQTDPAGYFYRGETTETGIKTPEDIVGGVAARTANQNSVSKPALFGAASDGTETGIKSPEDIIAGVQNRAGVSADMDNTGRVPVFNNGGGEGTVTGISSPEEIIANVQQRQAQTKTIEDQKAVISQYLDNNTIEQMGGEDNYNWLMNVVRSGTPDEVQKAYQTVVSSTAATKRQEAEARQRTAPVYTQGDSLEMTTPRSRNPNVNAVLQAAHDQNFDAGLALAVAAVESGGGDVNEIHMAGHDGMFQIEPETAQNYGVADKYPDWQTNPYQNAMAGIEVLKAKIDEKDGDTWAGVAHYNGGGDPDYLPKVQAAYNHTSDMADSVTTGGASYDGFRLTLPDSDEFTDQSGNVDGLTEDTHMKLRVLDNLCYQKFGQHLIVSSSYREGDPNNHGAGVAFDVSGGIVDDPDARQWLEQAGPAVGLFVIPEYQGEAGAEFAHGDNVHFSNVEPGIYGQTRDAEGHWSEEHAAPSIQSILNGSGSATSAVKGKSSLSQWGSNGFTDALHHWEDAVIPDVAGQMREDAPEDTGLFDGIFTIDDKGQEYFKDTPKNREIIKKQYPQQVQDAAMEAMAKDLLRTPAVQQSAVANPLSHAVEHGDTTAMMKLARQWFDVKTPNLDRERTQSYIAQPTARPIGGMEVETNRSTRQNQADSTETVPHQDVDTLSGQSQETRAGIQGIVRPATQGEIPVTATPAVVTEQVSRPMAPSRPATLPDDARISAIGLSQADTVQNPINAWGNQNPEGVFDKTILQGRPVIRQQEVLEDDQNIGDVKHLQDTLFHKGEAVFNVDDFEAEKNKRGSSYTIQDYAKEWLARKTPNVKRDTAAYQALEKEITQQMGNAYVLTQKETKKATPESDVQEEIAHGKRAMAVVLQTKRDVKAAMHRDDVGDIDFIYGTPGKGSKFKKGYGIAHIKAKRDSENGSGIDTLNKLVEVIAKGTDTEIQHANGGNGEYRLKIHYGGYTAILSSKTEKANSWLLTGWEDKKEAPVNARSEGYDSSTATTATPTLTRRSGETGTSSTSIITQKAEKGNKPDELDGVNILWEFF
ncbi:transglycosylase SLT domain-containing protein [Megasphaera sp.]|uniref:putative barnase/colicin E5 family endoribonuclease n=1 Tax=Megasphaera sp. TaxID=2023260 RepID=UPI003F00634A